MYPVLFHIRSFAVNTYGVFLALAFLGAIFVTVRLAARDGLAKERIYDLCLWLLLSSLIGTKLNPTQLYESFAMLIAFFFLLWLHKRRTFSGQVILAYAIIYSTIRFLIEFVRDDPRGDILGLTTLTGLSTSQMIGIVVGLGALVTLVIRWRRANVAEALVESADATPARV